MKTKVFIYKGVIGIQSSPAATGIITKAGLGNLGCVFDAAHIEISEEALIALKSLPKEKGTFGEIEVFKSGDKVVFGWLGGYRRAFIPSKMGTSINYNPSLLKSHKDIEIPKDFKDYVDSLIARSITQTWKEKV